MHTDTKVKTVDTFSGIHEFFLHHMIKERLKTRGDYARRVEKKDCEMLTPRRFRVKAE